MSTGPLISVIMPALNAASHIGDAIRSVLDQTWQNWDLLVVDNGSQDDTARFVSEFNDPRIRSFLEHRRGVAHARNKGLDNMRGSFFAFLDSDDLLPPRSLEARASILLARPELQFADGAMERWNAEMTSLITTVTPGYSGPPFERLIRIDPSCFIGNTWMVRRSPGTEVRFPIGMSHSEDLAFYLLLGREGYYGSTNEVVLRYRTGHGSAMSDLEGQLNGYVRLLLLVRNEIPGVTQGQFKALRQRVQGIMLRSYLKEMRPLAAIKALLRLWR